MTTPTTPLILVSEIARSQHGCFSRAQARDAGITDDQIARRLRTGEWCRVDLDAFRHASTPDSPRLLLMAATLTAGAPASHRSAAWLHGLFEATEPEVTVATNRRYRTGLAIAHRSLDLLPSDLTLVDGIPCTNVARTLLDLGAVLPLHVTTRVFDRALDRGLVSVGTVTDRFLQVARRGRRGVGQARKILEERDPTLAPLESELEVRALRVLVVNGLPMPVAQHEVRIGGRTYRLDLAYPADKIAIELDGRVHNEGDVFDRDRARQNALLLAGWLVLRFTWPMVRNQPAEMAHRVRQAMALRRAAA